MNWNSSKFSIRRILYCTWSALATVVVRFGHGGTDQMLHIPGLQSRPIAPVNGLVPLYPRLVLQVRRL